MIMIGYKGFDKDFKCRGFQYEVGKTYLYIGEIKICERGFHFCKRLNDVFIYYPRRSYYKTRNRYAIVEALGRYITEDKSKYVTDKIRIIKELSEEEMHEILSAEEADRFKLLFHREDLI